MTLSTERWYLKTSYKNLCSYQYYNFITPRVGILAPLGGHGVYNVKKS